jgi:hypothetical protein
LLVAAAVIPSRRGADTASVDQFYQMSVARMLVTPYGILILEKIAALPVVAEITR